MNIPPETLKVIIVTIPLPVIIPPKGYLAIWSFKAYWYYYYAIVRSNFRNMRVGTVGRTIMSIPKAFVLASFMVKHNLEKERILAYSAYKQLIGQPLDYNVI